MAIILEREGKNLEGKTYSFQIIWHWKFGSIFCIYIVVRNRGTLPPTLHLPSPSNPLTNLLIPNVQPTCAKANMSFGLAFELVDSPLASVDKVIQLCLSA